MAKIPIGIQLYTVRDECQKDFKGTVTQLAQMGYQGVELCFGVFGGLSPDPLAAFLKEVRLRACGLHAPFDALLDAGSDCYAYARAVKSPYITTSCADRVAQDWPGTIEKIRQIGRVAKSAGVTFTYHNHSQEFARFDGQYALDQLYAKTDPKEVRAELDTYWIMKGGAEAVPYLRQYGTRVAQIHLKDMDRVDGSFTEVGYGTLDVPGVFAAARDAKTSWVIYEQDLCKRPPLESAKMTMGKLREMGFAS